MPYQIGDKFKYNGVCYIVSNITISGRGIGEAVEIEYTLDPMFDKPITFEYSSYDWFNNWLDTKPIVLNQEQMNQFMSLVDEQNSIEITEEARQEFLKLME